ncbi:hypothetical protein ACOME3_000001 [Neoechinorhynchus agilis]
MGIQVAKESSDGNDYTSPYEGNEQPDFVHNPIISGIFFTPPFAYETIADALKSTPLHPRYRAYLESVMELLRFRDQFDRIWLNEAANRYVSYPRCGKDQVNMPVSFARQLSFKIVKLRPGTKLVLSSIAFHISGNPAAWRSVLSKVREEIKRDWSYYGTVALNVPDTNTSIQTIFDALEKGKVLPN